MKKNNEILDIIWEYLKQKASLSELEIDILDSIKEYKKVPSNKVTLINQIRKNIVRYNWLIQEEMANVTNLILNGINPVFTPFEQSDIDALLNKLYNQIVMMYATLMQQSGYFMP